MLVIFVFPAQFARALQQSGLLMTSYEIMLKNALGIKHF